VRGFTAAALELLKQYSWPGNVRELENLVEQAYVFCDKKQLDTDNLPDFLRNPVISGTMENSLGVRTLPQILDDTERRLLLEALQRAGGVKSRMAKILGIKPSALYYKLEKYGLLDEAAEKNHE
jgi:two-component system response regulator HydG